MPDGNQDVAGSFPDTTIIKKWISSETGFTQPREDDWVAILLISSRSD